MKQSGKSIHLIFKLLIVEDNEINEHTLNWEFLHQFDIKEEKKRKWANEKEETAHKQNICRLESQPNAHK